MEDIKYSISKKHYTKVLKDIMNKWCSACKYTANCY